MGFLNAVGLDAITVEAIIKVVASMAVGALVGWERERGNQPAGLRTHMLVCMGSCLVMAASVWFIRKGGTGDAMRMGAQVISGIGFLGAGTIIKSDYGVRGLTTAASLWVVACIGLALGAGFYWGAIIGAVLTYAALVFFKNVEERATHVAGRLHMQMQEHDEVVGQVVALLHDQGVNLNDFRIKRLDGSMQLTVIVEYPQGITPEHIVEKLMGIEGMEMVHNR